MIEKSLQLLQTDHVDLWQLHDIGTMTDINDVFAKGGAMEALLQMKDQKVVRNLGLTGQLPARCAYRGHSSAILSIPFSWQ